MKRANIILSLILCITLISCEWIESIFDNDQPDETVKGLYIGIVGFNDTISIRPMTNNVTKVKSFINNLKNKTDATAMCYGISEGISLLKNFESTREINQSFIVVFTDGFDNFSANYFDGIYQSDVISYTKDLLSEAVIDNNPIKCFTIGLSGNGVLKEYELEELAVNGEYKEATSFTLSTTFNEIANSLIATSKNFSFVTNSVPISIEKPKYVQIKIGAATSFSTYITNYTIEGEFYNIDGNTPIFKATYINENIYFEGDNGEQIYGSLEGHKAVVPLKNLTIKSTTELYYISNISVKIRWSIYDDWVEDVEDSSIDESIAKNIAIILVLDCSSSLGDYFEYLKQYSKELINTLSESKME